jgi:hypothetical protein
MISRSESESRAFLHKVLCLALDMAVLRASEAA